MYDAELEKTYSIGYVDNFPPLLQVYDFIDLKNKEYLIQTIFRR